MLHFADTNFCVDSSDRRELTLAPPIFGLLTFLHFYMPIFRFLQACCYQKDVSGRIFTPLIYEIVYIQVNGCVTIVCVYLIFIHIHILLRNSRRLKVSLFS